MTTELLVVGAEWSVGRVARFLIDNGISGAPVTDDDRKLLGVVSLSDLVSQGSKANGEAPRFDAGSAVTADQVMTSVIFSVEEDTPIEEIAGTMLSGRIHRVMVTKGAKVVGIVSTLDLLKVILDGEAAQ